MSSLPLVLVTGATDGIGRETAIQLARLGARVIVHGRAPDRVAAAAAEIKAAASASFVGQAVGDFGSFAEVRAMAARIIAEHGTLDVLVNNAGTYVRRRAISPDSIELTLQVNHLAPFLLTHLLLPALEAAAAQHPAEPARIVNVAAGAHLRARIDWSDLHGDVDYDDHAAFAASKLAVVLGTVELSRRLKGRNVVVNAADPGVARTKLLDEMLGGGDAPPASLTQAAATSIYLALAPEAGKTTGRYYVDRRPSRMHPLAGDPGTTAKLYAVSAKFCGIPGLPRVG